MLFAIAIDGTLPNLCPAAHGISNEQLNVTHPATSFFSQTTLASSNAISHSLRLRGLEIRPNTCSTYAFTHSTGRLAVEDAHATFKISGVAIDCLAPTDIRAYMDIDWLYPDKRQQLTLRMKELFDCLKSAHLSPCQVVHIANDSGRLKLIYEAVHADISLTDVEALTPNIPTNCLRNLGLPRYLIIEFVHLTFRLGRLSIRNLVFEVVNQRLETLEAVHAAWPTLIGDFHAYRNKLLAKMSTAFHDKETAEENWLAQLREHWQRTYTQSLEEKVCTSGLVRRDLINDRYYIGNIANFRHQVELRTNLLGTRSVLGRLDSTRPRACRHCAYPHETNSHALSACSYVTAAMTKRHTKSKPDSSTHSRRTAGHL